MSDESITANGPPGDLVGSAEAQRILRCDRATITRRVAAGRLPTVGRVGTSPNAPFVFVLADVYALALAEAEDDQVEAARALDAARREVTQARERVRDAGRRIDQLRSAMGGPGTLREGTTTP